VDSFALFTPSFLTRTSVIHEKGNLLPILSLSSQNTNGATQPQHEMIVFDKDGTLTDCTKTFQRWVNAMTNEIIIECESSVNDKKSAESSIIAFHNAIGWNPTTENVYPSSMLAAGTWEDILHETHTALSSCWGNESVEDDLNNNCDVKTKVMEWHENVGDLHGFDEPLIDDLRGLFQDCKERGLITAICTSDDRTGTDACMNNWDLRDVVDFSICGDEVTHAKPHANPLQMLCEFSSVSPEKCVVVGDTTADAGMGKNGNAGLVVGVLTGSGTPNQLMNEGAHILLSDVGKLPQLFDVLGLHKVSSTKEEEEQEKEWGQSVSAVRIGGGNEASFVGNGGRGSEWWS